MSMIDYTIDEHVAVVTMKNGENRFNPDFLTAFIDTLDILEKDTEATTLVVTSAHEKIFSNGIDLEWLIPVVQQEKMQDAKDFFYLLNKLFRRTVFSPMITIGALSGHAFAGGAIWSCGFDFRFMRSDRGFFCFPEVDLGIPFLPGMLALLKKTIPMYKLEEMHHTGSRLTAEQCLEHHMITKACHIDTLMDDVIAYAKTINKKRAVITEMKSRLYKNIAHCLDVEDIPYIESEKFNIG
ncbi:enoyl-CoA hydratase/isomerase family protein [Desulfobacterales bacterium HSG16]|nr:enoyl-CoA hydratase/isomerase family protein [Desulfobacterales bacterium HSG16]